jgi:hypothetical protein
MDPARRAAQHRRAAHHFAREGAKLAAAHHLLLGGGDADEVRTFVMRAMREAHERLAFADAARLGERALPLLGPGTADECAMRIAVGEAWILAGDLDKGRATCLSAMGAAEAIGERDLLARAALTFAAEHGLGRDESIVTVLRRALLAVDEEDSALRAELLARLGIALIPHRPGERDETARLRSESVAMARRVGVESALFAALRCAIATGLEEHTPEERLAIYAETLALGERLGATARLIPVLGFQVAARLDVGDPDGAVVALASAVKLTQSFPQPHHRVRAPLLQATLAALQGRFDESLDRARDAVRIAEQSQIPEALLLIAVNRSNVQYIRDDAQGFAEFEPLIERMMGSTRGGEMFHAFNHAVAGRVEEARAALSPIRRMPLDAIPYVAGLGWVCVRAGLTEYAEFFYDITVPRLAKVPILFGPAAVATFGPLQLLAGRLAAMLGRRADAERHYLAALALAEAIRARPYIAQTELALAELTHSRERASRAAAIATELGMKAVAARAAAICGEERAVSLDARGDHWTLTIGDRSVSLASTKGLAYLQMLLRTPHQEIHCVELAGAEGEGDAGPMLDARAKEQYRARAEVLRGELEEATRHQDRGRMETLGAELEALGDELARAVGLGGRDRRAGSIAERARINVQRRLKDAIRKVSDKDRTLGRHLELSVRTGVFCVYTPTWPG